MSKITTILLAFGIAAGFAVAGDEGSKEGCPAACKGTAAGQPTALAAARKALIDAPKAEEKLTAEQKKELKDSRDFLMQTSFGKAMGPTFEACGWLTIAAAVQPGTTPEAAALLKDMGATYCAVARMFGGCAGCECCDDSDECCEKCKADMTPDAVAKKAKESADVASKLLAVAKDEKLAPEQQEKIQAHVQKLQELSPCMPAMQGATVALTEAFASLARMGIPSSDGKTACDELVKAAIGLQGAMSCSSCEECEECEDAGETEEAAAPAKSS